MKADLIKWPTDEDWMAVQRRALVTVGLKARKPPANEWRRRILEARHSPIRCLWFSFELIDVPYWVSTHLCRHVHAQPYVRSQRNDRQEAYDRNEAPQSAPVNMIFDVNAEELMVIANKRLCNQASPETRYAVKTMCECVEERCPEFRGLLVPLCEYCGGVCHEMHPCGKHGK